MGINNLTGTLSRDGITGPDPDGSRLPAFAVIPAGKLGTLLDIPPSMVRLGAVSDTPGTSLAVSVHFLDSAGGLAGVQRVTFTAPSAPDWGASCVGVPDGDPWWPFGGARFVVVKVDSVSGGTWSINGTAA